MKHASPNPTYYVQPQEFGCKSLSSEDIKHYEGLKAAGYLTKSTELQLWRISKCFTNINKFKSNFIDIIILPITLQSVFQQ